MQDGLLDLNTLSMEGFLQSKFDATNHIVIDCFIVSVTISILHQLRIIKQDMEIKSLIDRINGINGC